LLSSHADKLTDDGRPRLVRHEHLPECENMTGIGGDTRPGRLLILYPDEVR
jgi:hypothetical protein